MWSGVELKSLDVSTLFECWRCRFCLGSAMQLFRIPYSNGNAIYLYFLFASFMSGEKWGRLRIYIFE